ncbi:hypothetical protein LUZ60_000870 [Juncus effusus]|nr:hypothetical protein LUZ60_000870 [Juncus effusus]
MARGLRGVRDDLSELGRQLLDIACFLHPLLSPSHTDSPPHTPRLTLRRRSPSPLPPSPPLFSGIFSDLAEIGGALRGGLSRLSVTLRAPPESPTETAAIASFMAPRPASPAEEAVGVSDDLVQFVATLARCPDSWVEFPVPTGDEFNMTYTQRDHIAAMERLAPELSTLRAKLCPDLMHENSFWKIYFTLLHPKLNEHDSELLSTQQVVNSIRLMLRGTEIKSESSDSSEKETSLVKNKNRNSSQSSIAQSFMKIKSDQSIDNQWIFTKTRSQQSMDQWSEIPSDVDNYNYALESSNSRHDLSSSDVERANVHGHGVNVMVMDQYMDSLLSDGRNVGSLSSSVKRDYVRRKNVSADWRSGEESEFELVDS